MKHLSKVKTYSNDHGYVPLVVNTSLSFPHSRLNTGFVTRLTRRVSLVEQELLTLSEHPSSPPVFGGVRATGSLALYVCFVDRCLSFCTFSFWPLCCLFLYDIRIHDYPFGIFKLFSLTREVAVIESVYYFILNL